MAQRGDYLVLKTLEGSGSVSTFTVIAETTSISVDISAEFLETTSQDTGLNEAGIGGKVSCTITGSYLKANTTGAFEQLFALMNAGTAVGYSIYSGSTPAKIFDGDAVITNLSLSGGNSDQLVTGSYTLKASDNPAA